MSKYIVLSVSSYNFPNEETGEIISGTKMTYLDDEIQEEQDKKGYFPITLNLPFEDKMKFENVPGVYDLDFKHVAGSKGKPTLKLKGAEFIKKFELPKI